jgi:hypothetical protein
VISAAQLAAMALSLLGAAVIMSALLALALWWRNRHHDAQALLECSGVSHQIETECRALLEAHPARSRPALELHAHSHGGYPEAARTVHVRPIAPSKAEMLAPRASAQAAADEHQRTSQVVTNPYPAGSRKAIVWATFYLDAQMTGRVA